MLDTKEAASRQKAPTKNQVDKALSRDAFTCRCCGFISKKYQRTIPMDQLSLNEKADPDLVTVCSFCELTASLDRAGQTGSGYLIWLPELSQTDLNHAVRALYIARASSNAELSKAAARTLDVLTSRRAEVKKRLGTDDPLILATALLEQVKSSNHAARKTNLEGVRFFPLDRYFVRLRGRETNVFPQMLDYWISPEGPYGNIPVDGWTKLFDDVSAKASE